MSCFKGQMDEYTSIAIDRFDGKNLQCTVFFLSHCHKDHMFGLSHLSFFEYLNSRQDVFLYCTEISRILLLADKECAHLGKFIRTLDVGSTHYICIPKNTKFKEDVVVRVTLISAGHCPGSVMFLFEGKEGTALYTGDFRWEVNQSEKISAFREGSCIKPIKSLYIDTTFCIPEAFHFPSRAECLSATLDLVSDWLGRGDLHIVSLSCPARYGHEHLVSELGKRLNTKIHVPEWKIDIYNQISELQGIFSHDPNICRIHSCHSKMGFPKAACLPCGHTAPTGERFRVLNIRPSTMWFTSDKTRGNANDLVAAPASHRGLHRVCYSMHSSYSEIRDVVTFLKPDRVFPNVLPAPDSDMRTVQARLNKFLKISHKARMQPVTEGESFKPLGLLRIDQKNSTKERHCSGGSSSEELAFSSQDQPPNISKSSGKASVRRSAVDRPELDKISDNFNSFSQSESSYNDSNQDKNEELNLFSDEAGSDDVKDETTVAVDKNETDEESLRLYISGESEVEDADDENDAEAHSQAPKGELCDNLVVKAKSNTATLCDKIEVQDPATNYLSSKDKSKREITGGLCCGKLIPDDDDNFMDGSSDSDVIPNSQEITQTDVPFKCYLGLQLADGDNKQKELNRGQIGDSHSKCDEPTLFKNQKPTLSQSPNLNEGHLESHTPYLKENEHEANEKNNIKTSNEENEFGIHCGVTRGSSGKMRVCKKDKSNRSRHSFQESDIRINSDLVIVEDSISLGRQHTPVNSQTQTQSHSYQSTAQKRKNRGSCLSDSEEEDSSVEFLYEHSAPLDMPAGEGWLSKHAPIESSGHENEMRRSKIVKHSESSFGHPKPRCVKNSQQVIDLTSDDTL